MAVNKKKRSSISVKLKTKDALDSLKHAGQSYDGLIQELIKFWNERRKGGDAISR